MAVLSVSPLFTSRGGSQGFDFHRTYTRVFEVVTDDPNDDEQVVANAAGIPVLGDANANDTAAVVVGVNPEQSDDSPFIWYVTVEYDTNPPSQSDLTGDAGQSDIDGNPIDKTQPQQNPLAQPATWKVTTQDSEEPVEQWIRVNEAGSLVIIDPDAWVAATAYKKGKFVKNNNNVYLCVASGTSAGSGGPSGTGTFIVDGTVNWNFYATYAQTQNDPNYAIRSAVMNSAGLPFDPPAMAEVSRPVLSVTHNLLVEQGTIASIMFFKNAVNVSTWRGVPPRCAKVLKIEHDGGKTTEQGVPYITTHWEIGLDIDTWDLRVLDAGYYEKVTYTVLGVPVTGYQRIKDGSDEPVTEPVPLDGNGRALGPGEDPVFLRGVPRQTRFVDFNTAIPW